MEAVPEARSAGAAVHFAPPRLTGVASVAAICHHRPAWSPGLIPRPGSGGAPTMTVDDLASVLANVIASTRSAEDIRDHTGVVWEDVEAAVAHLLQRNVIRDVGGKRYHATQALCAGPCSRGGRTLGGQEVVVNAQTLGWMCAACWDAGAAAGGPAPAAQPGEDDEPSPSAHD
jgi:hypothetical protein